MKSKNMFINKLPSAELRPLDSKLQLLKWAENEGFSQNKQLEHI